MAVVVLGHRGGVLPAGERAGRSVHYGTIYSGGSALSADTARPAAVGPAGLAVAVSGMTGMQALISCRPSGTATNPVCSVALSQDGAQHPDTVRECVQVADPVHAPLLHAADLGDPGTGAGRSGSAR